jgi:hypothetical protein
MHDNLNPDSKWLGVPCFRSASLNHARKFGASIYLRFVKKKDLFCPQIKLRWDCPCANGGADRIRSANYETDLKLRLVRATSLFMFRTFSAQINWLVISRKVLFASHRFLSNKSPIHFAGKSGKGNTFLNGNGMFKTQMDIDHHGPRLIPNNSKNLDPPYFSLPTTFKCPQKWTVFIAFYLKQYLTKLLWCNRTIVIRYTSSSWYHEGNMKVNKVQTKSIKLLFHIFRTVLP